LLLAIVTIAIVLITLHYYWYATKMGHADSVPDNWVLGLSGF